MTYDVRDQLICCLYGKATGWGVEGSSNKQMKQILQRIISSQVNVVVVGRTMLEKKSICAGDDLL